MFKIVKRIYDTIPKVILDLQLGPFKTKIRNNIKIYDIKSLLFQISNR